MGFYDKHVLPIGLNLSCGTKVVQRQRQKVVPLAEGRRDRHRFGSQPTLLANHFRRSGGTKNVY